MKRFCLVMMLLAMCFGLTSCRSGASTDGSIKAEAYYNLDSDVTVGLVTIGVDDRYTIHLDVVSDVLYLESRYIYGGGLTVMMDPDVPGKPLTYQRYLELWNAKKDAFTAG